jgi:prepilin-type N-terminal cleavage/methylation domain-containing protein
MSPSRHGFTLLEVLVACVLLAAVSTMAFSWISSESRASRAAKTRLEAMTAATIAMHLLQEDLIFAVVADGSTRFVLTDEHTLRLTTLSRQPGEDPGFHQVTWRFIPETHQLVRGLGANGANGAQLTPAPRLVTSRLNALMFSLTDQGRLMASIRLSGNAADDLVIPLTGGNS